MAITVTLSDKNSLAVTNESKNEDIRWMDADFTWEEGISTWAQTGTVLSLPAKNTLTITLTNKN